MEILGFSVDPVGSSYMLLYQRLAAAEKVCFGGKIKLFRGKAKRMDKLAAWIRYVHPTVINRLRSLHVNRQILHVMRIREFRHLRIMMKCKRRAWKYDQGETYLGSSPHDYKKTAGLFYVYFMDADSTSLHGKALQLIST